MKKRYLLIAAIIFAFIGVWQMVNNRNQAVTMAQKIIAKDDAGDDVTADIKTLSDFVHGHTRASVTFTLNGSYNRAVRDAQQAAAGGSGNAAVYQAAQQACTSKDPVAMARCITNYVQTHAAPGAQPKAAQLPDKSKFDYRIDSPGWAFDGAGLAFLGSVILIALTLYFALLGRKTPAH